MHESRAWAQIELLGVAACDSVRGGGRLVADPVGVLDEELIMSIGPGQFVLPDMCCMCLGESELMHECSTPGGKDGQSFVRSYQVPICRACQSLVKKKRAIIGVIGGGLIGGTLFAMWAMEGAWVAPWNAVGVAAFFLGVGLLVWLMAFQPAILGNDGRFVFLNKDYQRVFDQANGLPEAKTGLRRR